MKNKIFLILVLLMSALLAVLNFYAGQYFWYWRFSWFDLLMHFIGGITLALLFSYLYKKLVSDYEKIKLAYSIFLPIIIIAVLWEIMEFMIDANLFGKNYFIDTLTDIFIALFGALIIFLFSDKIDINGK